MNVTWSGIIVVASRSANRGLRHAQSMRDRPYATIEQEITVPSTENAQTTSVFSIQRANGTCCSPIV